MNISLMISAFKKLFTFGCAGSSLLHRLFLVAASRGSSLLWCMGFSLQWLLLQYTSSRHTGFSSCCMWTQQLWLMGLVARWHVGCSQIRDQTRVPCTGTWILNHWSTREAQEVTFGKHPSMGSGSRWSPPYDQRLKLSDPLFSSLSLSHLWDGEGLEIGLCNEASIKTQKEGVQRASRLGNQNASMCHCALQAPNSMITFPSISHLPVHSYLLTSFVINW